MQVRVFATDVIVIAGLLQWHFKKKNRKQKICQVAGCSFPPEECICLEFRKKVLQAILTAMDNSTSITMIKNQKRHTQNFIGRSSPKSCCNACVTLFTISYYFFLTCEIFFCSNAKSVRYRRRILSSPTILVSSGAATNVRICVVSLKMDKSLFLQPEALPGISKMLERGSFS